MKQRHFVIGHMGEVGSSIYRILKKADEDVIGIDLMASEIALDEKKKFPNKLKPDFIHICMEDSIDFIANTKKYICDFAKETTQVIIHSTVKPFTTMNIAQYWQKTGYSPVRGVHPHLDEDIIKFPKFYASHFIDNHKAVDEMYVKIGLKPVICADVTALEFSKHCNTVYYGALIAITQDIMKMIDLFNLDKELIYQFIESTGDRILMPYVEKIGGHCVVPNAETLRLYGSTTAEFVVNTNKKFSEHFGDKRLEFHSRDRSEEKDKYFPKASIGRGKRRG